MPSSLDFALVRMFAGSLPASGFREREGRDRALGEAREKLLLLRVGAEELERLRQPDRLVRGEQRGE